MKMDKKALSLRGASLPDPPSGSLTLDYPGLHWRAKTPV